MTRPKIKREIRKCKMCPNTFKVKVNSNQIYCSSKCSNIDPEIKKKIGNSIKKTISEKYDGIHYMNDPEIQKKHKQSIKNKYGVEYALQNVEVKEKFLKTMNDKYGVDYACQNKELLNKSINKRKEIYDSQNNFQKRRESIYKKIINEWTHLTPLFELKDLKEKGLSNENKYKFKCNKCGNKLEVGLNNGYTPNCRICNYSKINKSISENEITEYIQSIKPDLKIIQSDRKILKGLELDIYIPELKFAIEVNGIYWHSELKGKNKNYHLNKTKLCAQQGIQLLHFFDYHWETKKNIIKSIINSKLNKNETIYARKCKIKEVNSSEKRKFINRTHLQGDCNSSINIGLFHEEKLVSIITFKKSRYDKKFEWEITRFSSELGIRVVGGFSKMLKYFINNYDPNNIMTYADRSISVGNVYLKNGFTLLDVTKPNYFYIHPNKFNIFHREQFQKHKLEKLLEVFDKEKTEVENMKLNGYSRIWDCGNYKFVLNLK